MLLKGLVALTATAVAEQPQSVELWRAPLEKAHDDFHGDSHYHGHHFRDAVRQFHAEAKRDMVNPFKGGNDECHECVLKGSHFVIKMVADKVDHFCDANKDEAVKCHESGEGCGHKEHWCKFWHDKHDVALGFLWEEVRPMSLAFAWCKGHGNCGDGVHEVSDVVIENGKIELPVEGGSSDPKCGMDPMGELDLTKMAESGLLGEMGVHPDDHDYHRSKDWWPEEEHDEEQHHPGFFKRVFMRIIGRPLIDPKGKGKGKGDSDSSESSESSSDSDAVDRHHGKGKGKSSDDGDIYVPHVEGVCKHCYVRVFRAVMKMAIMGTKKMCASTECPFLQYWCKWAAEHREEAYGMILAKTEPWKYAIGRCWHPDPKGKGKGKGKHHHHHGHHRHGHKGKGKGRDDDDHKGNGKGDEPQPPPVAFMNSPQVPQVEEVHEEMWM